MQEHQQHDQRCQQHLGYQGIFKRGQGLADQLRAVVEGDDRHLREFDPFRPVLTRVGSQPDDPGVLAREFSALRDIFDTVLAGEIGDPAFLDQRPVEDRACGQALLDRSDLLLQVLDSLHGIRAIAHDRNPTHGFDALFVQGPSPLCRAQTDVGHVLDVDRDVVRDTHDRALEVFQLGHETERSNHVFDTVDLDTPRAHVEVRVPHRTHDVGQGHPVGAHCGGVDVDLVLLNVSTDRGNLADAFGGSQRIAHGPILNAA